ncbi:50S ribosomal protein L24 [Agrococcus jejuensis]|uniref:50S ribosomal protein L24 n=1 Tax=Agrococcus jejuensis TaxID=399736 RepID=UPI0011AABF7E|nr:50S ribosomal protein L24 [Agrococcus jejuensis]
MANIKKGDTVQVIAGARESRGGDRGKTGRVLEVLGDDRVIVEGVKLVTKHIKVGQTQRGTKTGGIETHESPIHVSNVALIDPESKKPTRVRSSITKVEKDGVQVTTKVRVSTRSGKEIKSND